MSDDPLDRIRVHGALPAHVAIIMGGNGQWARRDLFEAILAFQGRNRRFGRVSA
jgi:undecaprenyl pyrophosphate synthase